MTYNEYLELHKSCVAAMRAYFVLAETTSEMLSKCTAEPLSFAQRLKLLSQEMLEHDAHATYLNSKRLLHTAALRGYGYPN